MTSKRNILVYVAGKYTGKNAQEIEENIMVAREYAIRVWEIGYTAICPHLNTAEFEQDCKATGYDDFLEGDLEIISRCDAIFMMPNWINSKGAQKEREYALKIGVPVVMNLKDLIHGKIQRRDKI